MTKFSKRVENAVGKGEIALYVQFILFPQCFQKTCTVDKLKSGFTWGRVKFTNIYHQLQENLTSIRNVEDKENGRMSIFGLVQSLHEIDLKRDLIRKKDDIQVFVFVCCFALTFSSLLNCRNLDLSELETLADLKQN